jgi:hypothetical protein
VLLPIKEVERMETESKAYAAKTRQMLNRDDFDRGYFCGLADYGSKKALHPRAVCGLPNVREQVSPPDEAQTTKQKEKEQL